MRFSLDHTMAILERTPALLGEWLSGLPEEWTHANEGPDTWSAYDVVGHLIHGEKTDWMPRLEIILNRPNEAFTPFDRFAQFQNSQGKTLEILLDEFAALRKANLEKLKSLHLAERDFSRTGTHPALGEVTLGHLLATWAVHDLNHIGQVARVMAKQYANEVGPWKAYLGVLH